MNEVKEEKHQRKRCEERKHNKERSKHNKMYIEWSHICFDIEVNGEKRSATGKCFVLMRQQSENLSNHAPNMKANQQLRADGSLTTELCTGCELLIIKGTLQLLKSLAMDRIEFFERTENRNLKFRINFMVKQNMDQRKAALIQRRRSLSEMLAFENLQYDEELALFVRHEVEENARKRAEWIRTMRLERDRAEEELRRLKELQLELENCQEVRRLQSHELLLDTKRAQLYQIEEKKAWRRREKEIERMWCEISKRLDEEKEKHELFERKLRKIIADAAQQKNAQQFEETKARHAMRQKELQKEFQLDNERFLKIDREWRKREKINDRRKKLQQRDNLTQQIQENLLLLKIQEECKTNEEKARQEEEEKTLKENLEREKQEKISNRLWHQGYVQHCRDERSLERERDRQLDALLVGRECVLYEQNKKPYGKNVR